MTPRDPGWVPAGRRIAPLLIPFVGPFVMMRGARTSGLLALRVVFLSLVASLLLMLIPLAFVAPLGSGFGGPPALWAAGVLAYTVVTQAVAGAVVRRRPLPSDDAEALGAAFRSRTFLGIAFSESVALWAFVGVFIAGALWVYLVGLACALLGMARFAPTRAALERVDADLRARGSALSVYDALETPPAGQ